MSENKHTPEPWRVELVNHALGDTGDYEGVVEIRAGDAKRPMIEIWSDSDEAEANARRIVACVNALEGLNDYALSGGWSFRGIEAYAKGLEKQRDELLAALERCRFALEPYDDIKPRDWKSDRLNLRDAHQVAVAAIANMKGEQ